MLSSRVAPAAITAVFALFFARGVDGHGWMTSPLSKNEMAYHHYQWSMGEETDFHYEPQTSNHGNGIGNMAEGHGYSCGAGNQSYVEGLGLWQPWYDAAGQTLQIHPPECQCWTLLHARERSFRHPPITVERSLRQQQKGREKDETCPPCQYRSLTHNLPQGWMWPASSLARTCR